MFLYMTGGLDDEWVGGTALLVQAGLFIGLKVDP